MAGGPLGQGGGGPFGSRCGSKTPSRARVKVKNVNHIKVKNFFNDAKLAPLGFLFIVTSEMVRNIVWTRSQGFLNILADYNNSYYSLS